MDMKRKRELLEEYKNRHPQMGVISFLCKETKESFLGLSKDTKADFNSNRFKLLMGNHPNKMMQTLWNKYGENGFAFSVVETLKYDDLQQDNQGKLEDLLEQRLKKTPQSRRIWK